MAQGRAAARSPGMEAGGDGPERQPGMAGGVGPERRTDMAGGKVPGRRPGMAGGGAAADAGDGGAPQRPPGAGGGQAGAGGALPPNRPGGPARVPGGGGRTGGADGPDGRGGDGPAAYRGRAGPGGPAGQPEVRRGNEYFLRSAEKRTVRELGAERGRGEAREAGRTPARGGVKASERFGRFAA